jgi:hypothetical protein
MIETTFKALEVEDTSAGDQSLSGEGADGP